MLIKFFISQNQYSFAMLKSFTNRCIIARSCAFWRLQYAAAMHRASATMALASLFVDFSNGQSWQPFFLCRFFLYMQVVRFDEEYKKCEIIPENIEEANIIIEHLRNAILLKDERMKILINQIDLTNKENKLLYKRINNLKKLLDSLGHEIC